MRQPSAFDPELYLVRQYGSGMWYGTVRCARQYRQHCLKEACRNVNKCGLPSLAQAQCNIGRGLVLPEQLYACVP